MKDAKGHGSDSRGIHSTGINRLGARPLSGPLSEPTIKRLVWLDEAATALLDYRDPGASILPHERAGLAEYLDRGFSPSDAADAYQAASHSSRTKDAIENHKASIRDSRARFASQFKKG